MVTTLGRAWLLLVLLVPLIVGCDGCRLMKSEDEEARKLEQQLPPFSSTAAKAYPATRPDMGNGGSPDGAVKPGHWASLELSIRSNRDDRRGVVQSRAEIAKSEVVFEDDFDFGKPEPDSATSILVRRPAVLPKGQSRRLDTRILVPDRGNRRVEAIEFEGDFLANDATGRLNLRPSRFAAMAAQTYFFVILTDRPERFARLQTADWVTPFFSAQQFQTTASSRDNYLIVIPPTQGLLPLAETALDWTSTAVLLWDDVPTTALTPTQRTAVLDWLHFGGTIIVNGPAGVDSLADKTFGDLLPIQSGGVEELNQENATRFIRHHSIATDPSLEAVNTELTADASQIATAGKPRADAEEIGDGGLLIERRVGRGRIVQSRVDLLSDWFLRWRSYDSFFNAAVLARPPRMYRRLTKQELFDRQIPVPTNSDGTPSEQETMLPLRQTFTDVNSDFVDPAINTGVRLFSRDSKMPALNLATTKTEDTENDTDAATKIAASKPDSPTAGPLDPWLDTDTWTNPVSGLGGWKNDSPMLSWGRETLRNEIGVTIPESALVFRSLLIYLIVLIPVNYVIFRLLGRLEWAWLAVIPLSILGALWVARAAQLDVGFARSRNEIAMLEIPRNYSRGHLTRVIGLYNSLSSQYRIDFESPDAAIEVVKMRVSDADRQANLFGSSDPELQLGFEAGPSLSGISVGSNAYGVVHTEQIIDIDGTIGFAKSPEGSVDESVIVNDSTLELLDSFLVERDLDGELRVAALGTLEGGSRKPIRLQSSGSAKVPSDLPMNMTDWMQRLLAPETIARGSTRLIARVESPLGGMTITPGSKQVRSQTLVIVHLTHPSRPPATADENLRTDFIYQSPSPDAPKNSAPEKLAPATR